ncbi:hypothetical protein VTN77DRAFT_7004 [Rasamsonia byssochlamydoides]|uniref:uncharacterized protein n=1 Tax=Rasamsonia byssochlamydoides TaxID=89139 RepID=UPI003742713A
MPKKHNKYPSVKPVNPVHPSLLSSSNDRHRHGGSSSGSSRSVNDLIQHLRRTQVSKPAAGEGSVNSSGVVPRTVHPSIRNILELPETPPPRPRPNAHSAIGRRVRRTPGPPPPSSWLEGSSSDSQRGRTEPEVIAVGSGQALYRLERLPGVTFPSKRSLQHTVLMSMALNWTWHLEYDGTFLAELPNRMKMLLLSYIALYSRDLPLRTRMQGLHPLFLKQSDSETVAEPEITRLDLSGAIGRWINLKQLNSQLIISQHDAPGACKPEEAVPSLWDAESDSEDHPTPPLLKSPTQTLRFENLKFLSLAHPDPASASWSSLLNLLSHISTLTHLSLAYWPVPTLKPSSINARLRHPNHKSSSFSYGGTDTYSASEGNWAEASGVLRKLSRATYCLKWLDLEGCGEWFGALSWNGIGADGEVYSSPGPEWTGSWRDIEWVGLGPGWLPEKSPIADDDGTGFPAHSLEVRNGRPLSASIHAPAGRGSVDDNASSSDPALARDVEAERTKYRKAKELEAYENVLRKAREVEKHVHRIRKERGGKWVHFSFGGDGEEERVLLERTMKRIDER